MAIVIPELHHESEGAASSRQDENVVVRVSNLVKTWGTGDQAVTVLKGVSLTVHQGECLFLAGPSGSGKTTLLSILGCVLSATSGTVSILGHDVTTLTSEERAAFRCRKIGFVFQKFHLFSALTAAENVQVPCDLQNLPRSKSSIRARELLSLVGLADYANVRVNRLSMGQRQRVAVARALSADPGLILADEPTASLDAESGMNAMCLLKQLCRQLGKTVITVTHDSRIFELADRILYLSEGQLTDGHTSTTQKDHSADLTRLFGGVP